MTQYSNSAVLAVERPQTPSVFLFHEPQRNDRHAARSPSQVAPWTDVIGSLIADPKERAACLVMQAHAPLLGSAIPCSVAVSPSGSLLEITLCSRRSGIHPVELGSEKIRVVLASVVLVRTHLPEAVEDDEDDELALHRVSTWGNELAGSPMRGLRVCITLSGDPAQRTSDWSSTFRETRTAHSADSPPRHVVLYATSLREAQQWIAWLRQRTAKRDLIDVNRFRDTAVSRETNDSVSPSVFSPRPNSSTEGRTATRWPSPAPAGSGPTPTSSAEGSPRNSLAADNAVFDDDLDDLQRHAAWRFTTASLCHSLQDDIQQGSTAGGYRSLFEVKEAARMVRAAGRWCPFGEEWMRDVSPLIMRALLRWIPTFDEGSLSRSSPWIPCLLDGPTENCDKRHAIALEILWRLSTTTRATRSDGGEGSERRDACGAERGSVATSTERFRQIEEGPQRGLTYLQRRAHYRSADEFRAFSESKYLETEANLGRRIDAIRSRLREGTQTQF